MNTTKNTLAFGAILVALISSSGTTPSAQNQLNPVPTVLITGSNRGIGFEFARQYAEKGWKVLATARRPDRADDLKALSAEYANVVIERLDVTDHKGIQDLADKYKNEPIDVLINNAGVLGDRQLQTIESLEYATFSQVMAVNVYGALEVSQAFLNQVAASHQKKIVALTSSLGSLTLTSGRSGGFYFYRISKAGLNMAMRTLQADVHSRGISVAVISPGAVATQMLAETGFKIQAMSPEESVLGLIDVIESLGPDNAGSFLSFDGEAVPW
ncbi:MAG: SDR family oxidoreductase [Acidobacteriota bacterium]